MRFSLIAGVIACGFNLSEALVIPSTSSLDLRNEAIREIEAVIPRATATKTCKMAKTYKKTDAKGPKPDPKKISKGGPMPAAKRDESASDFDFGTFFSNLTASADGEEATALEARDAKTVTMGEVKTFTWTATDYAYTDGMDGCSAIALGSQTHLVWTHFPPMRAGVDATYLDTWRHFLSSVTNQAKAAGILDANSKIKAGNFVAMRISSLLWALPAPPKDKDGNGLPSAKTLVHGWIDHIGAREIVNFKLYSAPEHKVWVDRTSVAGGWAPVVFMSS